MLICTYAFALALGALIQLPAEASVQAALACFHPASAHASSLSAAATSASAPASQEKPPASSWSGLKQTCLNSDCHGPFEKLASAKPGFALNDGKKINQHMYVPHDMKDEINIPRCASCHKPHPLPLQSKEGLVKASLGLCYDECHHKKDFTPCKECHKRGH
jgi:hypothetical protein